MATIYKIEFNEYIYIGSTVNMKQRQYNHNKRLNGNTDKSHYVLYTTARENGIKEFELIVIEECSIDDRFIREQHYIDLNEGDKLLNCKSAKCDSKEYYQKNKERIIEKSREQYFNKYEENKATRKIYAEKNADTINDYKKQWYQDNKERLAEIAKQRYQENKERHKAYALKNIDRINQRRRERKDIINQRRRELHALKKQAELNDI